MEPQEEDKGYQNGKLGAKPLDWANADGLYDSDESPQSAPNPPPEAKDSREGETGERRGHRGRRRGRRYRRGGQTRYEAKQCAAKTLRELVPARPGEITNVNPGISVGKCCASVEMIRSAKAPYVVQFLNCPEGMGKESFAEFFGVRPDDVNEVEPIQKTNGVLHTLVSISDQDVALKVFAKYTSDNVVPFVSHRK